MTFAGKIADYSQEYREKAISTHDSGIDFVANFFMEFCTCRMLSQSSFGVILHIIVVLIGKLY